MRRRHGEATWGGTAGRPTLVTGMPRPNPKPHATMSQHAGHRVLQNLKASMHACKLCIFLPPTHPPTSASSSKATVTRPRPSLSRSRRLSDRSSSWKAAGMAANGDAWSCLGRMAGHSCGGTWMAAPPAATTRSRHAGLRSMRAMQPESAPMVKTLKLTSLQGRRRNVWGAVQAAMPPPQHGGGTWWKASGHRFHDNSPTLGPHHTRKQQSSTNSRRRAHVCLHASCS